MLVIQIDTDVLNCALPSLNTLSIIRVHLCSSVVSFPFCCALQIPANIRNMAVLINALSVILALLGLLFVIGFQGQIGRLVIGLVLIASGVVLFATTRLRPKETTVVQKIDLTGDISTQELKCKNCGSTLTNKSVAVRAGAIFISCEFCGTQYQLEEAPKW